MSQRNMKRGPGNNEGGGGPGVKRPKGQGDSDKFQIRLLIPSKVAGSIIGKGGVNIQKLRTDNNANVRVPDCPGPERIMTVQSDAPEMAINVIEQTIPMMADDTSSGNPEEVGQKDVRLLIHQSIVGGIIGRAGFKIKEIREGSGANIKVYQTCAPQSTDRCVSVTGTVEKVVAALKLIMQIVEATEVRGPVQLYDPDNFDGFYAQEYGGYGAEGDTMASITRGRGARGYSGQMGDAAGLAGGYGSRTATGRGYSQGSYGDGGFTSGGFGARGGGVGFGGRGGFQNTGVFGAGSDGADGGSFGNPGGYGKMGGVPGMDSYAAGGFGGGGDGGEIESTQVTIPVEMAGAIIGPGGSRIRKIRSDSKASITIDEPLAGSNERIISISGTPRSIQTAQYLLQQSVRDHANQPSYGGPTGRF